jgi:membrane protein
MRWWHYLKETFNSFSEDRAMRMGAALAFYSIFSLAPILLIVVFIAGLIFGPEAARGELFGQIEGALGPKAAAALEESTENAYRSNGGIWATIIGIGLLVFGATGVFVELQDSLNQIWRVPARETSGWWDKIKARFLSFSVVAGCGFLLLISLVVSSILSALHKFVAAWDIPGGPIIWQGLHLAVAMLVITLLFAMIFKLLPEAELKWRDMWVGAFLTAVLFTVGKYLIGLYLAHGAVASTYGAAGTLIVVFIWVYYSSLIVLFGAEFTRVYAERGARRPAGGTQPVEETRPNAARPADTQQPPVRRAAG